MSDNVTGVNVSDDLGSVPWETVENGIAAWVAHGAGLDAEHVRWSAQLGPGIAIPVGRYVAMRISETMEIGTDWQYAVHNPDDSVEFVVEGPRVKTLQLRCYNGDAVGRWTPTSTLSRVLAAVRLPSIRSLMRKGNWAIGASTKARVVDAKRANDRLDPYGIVECNLHVTSRVSEPGSLIERVEVNVTERRSGLVIPRRWYPSPPSARLAAPLGAMTCTATAVVS